MSLSILLQLLLLPVSASAQALAPVETAPVSLTPASETPDAAPAVPVSPAAPHVNRAASFLPPAGNMPSDTGKPTATQPDNTGILIPAPVTLSPLSVPATAAPPASIATPVESAALAKLGPDSVGLIDQTGGGLGSDLWNGTPRAVIEKLLPQLPLPTGSAVLNGLAKRLLMTVAVAPESQQSKPLNLTALRADRLTALGDAGDGWKLARLSKPELIDDVTLRWLAENALVSSENSETCAALPELMKSRDTTEWQKLLLVCQLQAKDNTAAQVSLDTLHGQKLDDDTFLSLAEKNVMGGNKQLPRQLTPLKPLNLALLRLTDLPMRIELYAHPDAALIPELLRTKAQDETARLALAERAAARGLIDAPQLAEAYRSLGLPPDELAAAAASKDSGVRLRALLVQALTQEKDDRNRLDQAARYMESFVGEKPLITGMGVPAQVVTQPLSDIQPAAEYNLVSAKTARLYLLVGDKERTAAWLKQAHTAALGLPDVAAQLQQLWPLLALSGMVPVEEFGKELDKWLDASLPTAVATPDAKTSATTANVLMLLAVTGLPVPPEEWVKVEGTIGGFEKHAVPNPLAIDRLQNAGITGKRGETIIYSLLSAGDTAPDLTTALDIIRALRQVGLASDATHLAMESYLTITPQVAP